MTGGYLTLDFSDREFKEGDSIGDFTLGYKKGIYNYIKKTAKPIYIVLSASVMNAIQDSIKSPEAVVPIIPNKCVILLNPIFDFENNLITARKFLVTTSYYDTQQISCLDTGSLTVRFDTDDSIKLYEM